MAIFKTEQIRSIFSKKGYRFFENGIFNLNIIGIRSGNPKSNLFDDVLLVVFRDGSLNWVVKQFSITTDPGKHYLNNPLDKNGTLILLPGQYLGAYAIGIHGRSRPVSQQYKALEQMRPMRYVRDRDRNDNLDFSLVSDPKNIIVGNFKTNIHRASQSWLSSLKKLFLVGPYSAGCQVFEYADEFETFLKLANEAAGLHGNGFTYTLLEEKDFS